MAANELDSRLKPEFTYDSISSGDNKVQLSSDVLNDDVPISQIEQELLS